MNTPANVYDLVYPTPPALREIASIAVAVKLWRERINLHRLNNLMDKLPSWDEIPSNDMHLDLPSTILPKVKAYFGKIQFTFKDWLRDILDVFDDIVCDFDGHIHFVRTAKRAILCNEISEDVKFRLACEYCLEDDIMNIWPSVADNPELNDVDFHKYSLLQFWICILRNQLHEIPISDHDFAALEDRIGQVLRSANNWPFIEFFWSGINPTKRKEIAGYFFENCTYIFCRYMLAKLSEEEIDGFLAERNDNWLITLVSGVNLRSGGSETAFPCILAAWKFIGDKVSESSFNCLVREIIEQIDLSVCMPRVDPSFAYEFWNNTPNRLKVSAISNVLLDDTLFMEEPFDENDREDYFLLVMLADVSFEVRNTFWRKKWRDLLLGVSAKELRQFINLCFRNDEIRQFQQTELSKYENISLKCSKYFSESNYQELDRFLTVCCVEKKTIQDMKQKILQNRIDFFSNNDDVEDAEPYNVIHNADSFINFINDAYSDYNLAAEYKNQFLFAPRTVKLLAKNLSDGCFEDTMKFINMFVKSEQAAVDFKENRLMPTFHNLSSVSFIYEGFSTFIYWCLRSDDKIAVFKRSLCVDDVVRNIISEETRTITDFYGEPLAEEEFRRLYTGLVKFLEWCFTTSEEVEAFKKKFDGFEKYLRSEFEMKMEGIE